MSHVGACTDGSGRAGAGRDVDLKASLLALAVRESFPKGVREGASILQFAVLPVQDPI